MSVARTLRQLASTRAFAHRSVSTTPCLARFSLQAPLIRNAHPSLVVRRAFSVTPRARGEGASDALLVQRLGEELQFEKKASEEEDQSEPGFLKTFKEQGIWKIDDVPGNEEVKLTRTFGNETIRLVFSILDVQETDPYDPSEDIDEEKEQESEDVGEESMPTHSIRVCFTIKKNNAPDAININTMCQEGAFIVDNIAYYNDAKAAIGSGPDVDVSMYLGPHFDTLDSQLQQDFDAFLLERGVNDGLALFILEYAAHKEQKEYVRWLQNVKLFIEK